MNDPIELVLFDLGGVLVEFGGVAVMKELSGVDDDDELWRRWLTCPWVRGFERGECSADDFARGVVDEWALPVEPEHFLDSFAGWPRGPLPGADALVRSVRGAVPVGCLSNTNALHWERHAGRWAMFEVFDLRFLSFEIGAVKPDRELFEHVAASLPVPPGSVLFLDDNALNVEGALASGFAAHRVRGVDEAREVLVDREVLA